MIDLTKPLNLSKIKSAVVIEGSAEIEKFLMERDEKFREGSPADKANTQTLIESEDGRAKVKKRSISPAPTLLASTDEDTGLPSNEKVQELAEAAGVEWSDELVGRAVPYWASDERVDRHGDIVRQNFNFEEFEKNPVMPYSHNWDMPPIGNVIRHGISARSDKDYKGPALNTLNLFATEADWAFADTIFRLVKRGFLKSSSIGFYPGKIIFVEDDAERAELGLGRWGAILDENMLVEHSPTTVPANPGAHTILNAAKKDGDLKAHDIYALREMSRQYVKASKGDSREWEATEAYWLNSWGYLFPEVKLDVHKQLDVPFVLNAALVEEAEEGSKTLVSLADAVAELTVEVKSMKSRDTDIESQLDELASLLHLSSVKDVDVEDEEELDPTLTAALSMLGMDDEDEEDKSKAEDEDDDEDEDEDDSSKADDDEDEDEDDPDNKADEDEDEDDESSKAEDEDDDDEEEEEDKAVDDEDDEEDPDSKADDEDEDEDDESAKADDEDEDEDDEEDESKNADDESLSIASILKASENAVEALRS